MAKNQQQTNPSPSDSADSTGPGLHGSEQNKAASVDVETLMALVSKNFALLSAIFLALAITSTFAFTISYLWIFDLHLFLLVEYQDLIKIGMIFFGIILTALVIGIYIFSTSMIYITNIKERYGENSFVGKNAVIIVAIVAILLAFLIAYISGYIKIDEITALSIISDGRISTVLVFLTMPIILYFPLKIYEKQGISKKSIAHFSLSYMLFLVFGSYIGLKTALYIRSSSDFSRVFVFDDKTSIKAELIMHTSHHVFLYGVDHSVIVIPTDRLLEIKTEPSVTSQVPP